MKRGYGSELYVTHQRIVRSVLCAGGAGLDSDILPHCSNCRQESGNLDLSNGWDDVFSTATSDRVLVVRKGVLGAGRTYTFSLSAIDTSEQEGYAGKRYNVDTSGPNSS